MCHPVTLDKLRHTVALRRLAKPTAGDNLRGDEGSNYIYSNCGGFGYGCGILLRQQQLGQSRIRMFSFQRGVFAIDRGVRPESPLR